MKHLLCLLFYAWPCWVAATAFDLSSTQRVVGELQYIEVREGDTLIDIAYEFDLGYEEVLKANPEVDPWNPQKGQRVLLPLKFVLPAGERKGIYINTAAYRLYYYPAQFKGKKVLIYPISIGRGDWPTPKAPTHIVDKLVEPTWYPPPEVRREHAEWGEYLPAVVPAGEGNPLGQYALQLAIPGYLIHGTDKPYGIGMRVTHGCVRMRPHDIEELFGMVSRKTKVRIVDEPYTLGVESGAVYLESHTSDDAADRDLAQTLTAAMQQMLRQHDVSAIDWQYFAAVVKRGDGMPQVISWGKKDKRLVKAQRRSASTETAIVVGRTQNTRLF